MERKHMSVGEMVLSLFQAESFMSKNIKQSLIHFYCGEIG
jgi:hypothetical protein